ncbi:hypothetical protein POM88_041451 [Heracleum sosnowskyi]|uniref:Uncharacterized protein n=1 Tax=Heracleum sosnowskyi TaxID=360622 RepID=A0AAD8HGT0_9APIA|nr:hypothetical protein POM88_041451 [Heracleum sosnowskyi]
MLFISDFCGMLFISDFSALRKLELPRNSSELHEFELQHYIETGKRQVYHTPNFRFCLAQLHGTPSSDSATVCHKLRTARYGIYAGIHCAGLREKGWFVELLVG